MKSGLLLLVLWVFVGRGPAQEVALTGAGTTHPVAVAAHDAGRLVVAGRGGGLSLVSGAERRVVAEVKAGRSLLDVCRWRRGMGLAVDAQAHELLWYAVDARQIRVEGRVGVAPHPTRVVALPDGALVTSLWSHHLTRVAIDEAGGTERWVCELPFPPRELVVVEDVVLVAGAFRGELAVVSLSDGRLSHVWRLSIHNITALVLDAARRRLHLAHQSADPHATTAKSDVHWGLVIGHQLSEVSVDRVIAIPDGGGLDLQITDLGDVGRGAADPSSLLLLPGGRRLAALRGVHELALVGPDGSERRIPVSEGPVALAQLSDRREVAVVSPWSHDVCLVDLESEKLVSRIPLSKAPPEGPVVRGERLFHDARLSHDGWMSCHSCHSHGHTAGILADTLTDGDYGAPKITPSLRGITGTAPFGWTGTVPRLADQVRASITNTLHGPVASQADVDAMVAYLRSLKAPPPPLRENEAARKALRREGARVFARRKCSECHGPSGANSEPTRDVGLRDERGRRRFNPPRLRGLSQRSRYLHDGRARSLRALFTEFEHPDAARVPMTEEELRALVAFLETL